MTTTAMQTTAPATRITDAAVRAIAVDLTTVPPERGGALLGFGELIHFYLADTSGHYRATSWDISTELTQALQVVERQGAGQLAGTVHSHPQGTPDPSGTDVATTARALNENPHLDRLLIAIVTEGVARTTDLQITATHRMSMHQLRRGPHGPILERAPIHPTTLSADLSLVGARLTSEATVATMLDRAAPLQLTPVVRWDERERLLIPLADTEKSDGDSPYRLRGLLIDSLYPLVGPTPFSVDTVRSHAGPLLRPIPTSWDATAASGQQLVAITGSRRPSFARVEPLAGQLTSKHAIVVGAGSVGSRIAEDLVRSGIATLTIVDSDDVTAPNLARTVYTTADLGRAKVDALADRARAINPAVAVRAIAAQINDLDWPNLLHDVDLVIAATDHMPQQAALSHHTYSAGVPMIGCALYRKAAAGEVVLSVPDQHTPCWSCAVGHGTLAATMRPDTNYGLGQLVAEAALGPSITIVASVAAQQAIGLLAGPETEAGAPVASLLIRRRTLGIISTSPRWEFFAELFDGYEEQHAPQSIWITPMRHDTCPACGTAPSAPVSGSDGPQLLADLADLRESASRSGTGIRNTTRRGTTMQKKIIKPGMKPPAGGKPPRPAKIEGTASNRQKRTHEGKNRAVNHDHRR